MGFPPLKQPQAVAFETAAVGAMQPGIGRVPQQAGWVANVDQPHLGMGQYLQIHY